MTKVLGFDSWTRGAHHFQRLIPALRRRGIALKLVHLGSWGNDPHRQPVERLGDLDVADISAYPTHSLGRMLQIERPDAVILLSTTTFAHRALVRYCKALGIPTLNLYHGMSTTWFDLESGGGFDANALGYLKFIWRRLHKTIRRTLPCYVGSLIRTRASLAEWARFALDIGALAFGRQPDAGAEDARTTRCAVYTPLEIEHAIRTYHFRQGEVVAVGNPDIAMFGLEVEHIGSRLSASEFAGRIMYIDTALQPNGLVYPSVASFAAHLRETAESLRANGFEMLAKLHPANDMQSIRAVLDECRIEFVENKSFVRKLLSCDAAIVETTTLAMMPALIGMPLFFANYGRLRSLRFGSALTSYPRGRFLRNVSELSADLLTAPDRATRKEVEAWIANNAGPLPAEDMPDRVAALLETMVRRRGGLPAEPDCSRSSIPVGQSRKQG